MANEPSDNSIDSLSTTAGADSSVSVIDRVERTILDRRQFLRGAAVGGLTAGAIGMGASQLSGSGFQALASLAGGETTALSPTTYYLPAVEANQRGLIIEVTIEFADHEEGLFVNVNNMEVRHDLQLALREAIATARRLTNASFRSRGVLITFSSPGDELLALRGKSWEAGITVAFVAALTGAPLTRKTLVTGVVSDNGTLLPVGAIKSKARAARNFGASRLLVPNGQEKNTDGIIIEEVATINEAINEILNPKEIVDQP